MIFRNRSHAGKLLAERLMAYRGKEAVVLALPRGGVPVACEIASSLGLPLDLLLVRKIGLPGNRELAMGAVIDGNEPAIVRNEDVIQLYGISQRAFEAACGEELQEIARRRRLYFAGRKPEEIAGRTAIIVDDGIATGATVKAGILGVRKRNPARIILAAPVAAKETLLELEGQVDETVCLAAPEELWAIGYYYEDFDQLTDNDVTGILSACK